MLLRFFADLKCLVYLAVPTTLNQLGKSYKSSVGRNYALSWIQSHFKNQPNTKDRVIYFGNDDNTYDLRIFGEMRHTTKVTMFPVGFAGGINGYGVSSPILDSDGTVIDFHDPYKKDKRVSFPSSCKFAVDMASFAVNFSLFTFSAKC